MEKKSKKSDFLEWVDPIVGILVLVALFAAFFRFWPWLLKREVGSSIAMLSSEEPRQRLMAANYFLKQASSRGRPERAIPALLKLIEDRTLLKIERPTGAFMKVRNEVTPGGAAYSAIVKLTRKDKGPLIKALKDPDPVIQKNARIILQNVTGESFGADYSLWLKWWEEQKVRNKQRKTD